MRDIKVTIIGDSGVGKSSLVTSLVKDSFSPRVQAVVPEILLPLDVTDAGVTTRIVDTSSCSSGTGGSSGASGSSGSGAGGLAERRAHLEASLRSADVVLLVYDVARPTTFDRIPTYWLPYLRSLIGSSTSGKHVPVILVGNKIDARVEAGSSSGAGGAATTNENLEEELAPVMAEFGEVESCIETSVKEGVNVSEVFYFAQKAVLYPTAPLYDGKTHTLRPACIEALKRIFLLCDSDKDHLLSDEELNEFQRRCFGSPLSVQELEAIKDLVASAPYYGGGGGREEPRVRRSSSTAAGGSSSSNGGHPLEGSSNSHYLGRSYHPNLQDGKLTLHGWLHLHTLFIQKGRLETTWSVLSSYGYGPNLTLTPEYLNPPSFHVPSDCAVELSPYGYSFLTDIFEAHDADRDGALCDAELTALFATAPGGKHPWEGTGFPTRTTTTDDRGAVTLQGWLAQWSMTTLLDYKITLAYLAYLGYPGGAKRGMAALPQQQQPQTRKDGKPGPPPTGTALKLTRRNTRSLFSSAWSSYTTSSSASYQSPPKASSSSREGVEDSASKSSKKKKRGDPTERSVFLAYVLGAPGAGKSSLLNAALGKRFENEDEDAATMHGSRSVVTAVEPHLYYSVTGTGERGPPLVFGSTGGYERYLVLQEFPTAAQGKGINNNGSTSTPPSLLTSPHIPTSESSAASSSLTQADILLLLYDSSDSQSFSYLSNLRQRYASTLGSCPTLFVASKADKEIAKQRHEVQPEVYVRRLGLERWSPCRVSVGGAAGGVGGGQGGGMVGGAMGGMDHDLGSSSIDTTTAAAAATTSSPAATTATTSITQLLAVACAIAQDPRGNAAVPGLRAAHDRAGGSASWGSWLAGLVGLSSSSAAASKDEGSGIDEDGEGGEEGESDYDSEGEEGGSSPGQADDSSSPSPAASSLSSSVASSAGPAARRRRHGDTSTDQDGSKSRRSGKRGTRSSDSASTKTMRRNRRTRLRSASTGPSRRRALLVAFSVVLVGGGAVAAAAVALGVFDQGQHKRTSVSPGNGATSTLPRRWAANMGAWANAKGRALGAA